MLRSVVRTGSVLLLVPLVLSGCAAAVGNGTRVTESRQVGAFTRLAAQSGFQVTFAPGATDVAVTADENLLPLLETYVEGDTLILRVKPMVSVSPTDGLKARVANPVLVGLDASGGARVQAQATPTDTWALAASGGSDVQVTGLSATTLTLGATGGSRATVTGDATRVEVSASSGSTVDTTAVHAQTASLDVSGGSTVRIYASSSASGQATGGSTVTVSGSPAGQQVASSGGSTVQYPPP